MSALDKVLGRAQNVQRAGAGWKVSCPVPGHGKGRGDRNPSVTICEGDDGRVLDSCKAGCSTEDVIAGWGLEMSDLFEHYNGYRRGGGSYTSPETRSTHQHPGRGCTL